MDVPPGSEHGEVFQVPVEPQYMQSVTGLNFAENLHTLFVTVDVGKTEAFSLDGRDIVGVLELSPALALLGGRLSFPCPGMEVEVEVGPCTPSHAVLVVAERGVRPGGAMPGDLVLRTSLRVPVRLGWWQRRMWRRIAALEEREGLVEGVPGELDHR